MQNELLFFEPAAAAHDPSSEHLAEDNFAMPANPSKQLPRAPNDVGKLPPTEWDASLSPYYETAIRLN